MEKCIAYTALIIVCLGLGAIIGGVGVYFSKPTSAAKDLFIREAACELRSNVGSTSYDIDGRIIFSQKEGTNVTIKGSITGLPIGNHGFHIHTYGVLDKNCTTAGPHYNPMINNHGGPQDNIRHIGDLGNIETNYNQTYVNLSDHVVNLFGKYSVVGRSIVVHEKEDDLKDGSSAGKRLACCDIAYLHPTSNIIS